MFSQVRTLAVCFLLTLKLYTVEPRTPAPLPCELYVAPCWVPRSLTEAAVKLQ